MVTLLVSLWACGPGCNTIPGDRNRHYAAAYRQDQQQALAAAGSIVKKITCVYASMRHITQHLVEQLMEKQMSIVDDPGAILKQTFYDACHRSVPYPSCTHVNP